MTALVKSDPQPLSLSHLPTISVTEWAYENAAVEEGERVFWFTAETTGGYGLYAMGHALSASFDAGRNNGDRPLISLRVGFTRFGPRPALGRSDFAALDRSGFGSPLQSLNRVLYLNSHNKIAGLDDEVGSFLAQRFVE